MVEQRIDKQKKLDVDDRTLIIDLTSTPFRLFEKVTAGTWYLVLYSGGASFCSGNKILHSKVLFFLLLYYLWRFQESEINNLMQPFALFGIIYEYLMILMII